MSRTFHHGERRVRVHGVRRSDPDLRKLARALIELAQAEAEAEAQAEFENRRPFEGEVLELPAADDDKREQKDAA